jgi:hypothetical protein
VSDPRRALLDEYFALEPKRGDAAARSRRAALRAEYEKWLPRVPFARCPFTGDVFTHTLDTAGLDGLWWQYDLPVRGLDDERPPTYFAMTGAVALAGKPEPAPFDRLPGPGVPYVVPRMLLHDDVKAVVQLFPVGKHTAYAITYFARPVPPMLQRFNEWGTKVYTYETAAGDDRWDQVEEESEVLDTDLARWIDSGDLLWVAPADSSLSLRATVDGCPYVGLKGKAEFAFIDATAPRSRTRPSTAPAKSAPAAPRARRSRPAS